MLTCSLSAFFQLTPQQHCQNPPQLNSNSTWPFLVLKRQLLYCLNPISKAHYWPHTAMLEQPLTMQASSQQPVMQFTSSPAYESTSQITPLDPVSSSHSIDQLDHSDFSLQSSLTSNVSISVSHLDNSDSSFSIDQLNHSESSHYSSLSSVSIPVGELDQSDSSPSICQLDSESFCHSSSLDTHVELPNSSDLSSPANCQRQPSESNLFSSFSSTPSSSNSNLSNLNPEDSDHQSDCDEIYPTLVDIDESFLDPLYPGAKVSLLAALYLIM